MASVTLTNRAREELSELSAVALQAVDDALAEIATDPKHAGYPLQGRLDGKWSYRAGSLRIIYRIDHKTDERVYVLSIRPRRRGYGGIG